MPKNSQEKLMEALSGLLPENLQEKVTSTVASLIDEAVEGLKSEFETKLTESIAQVEAERAKDKETTQLGYQQAYEIIADLRNRLTLQKEELEQHLEEEYEEAYKIIVAEKAEKEKIYETVYAEFDQKLKEMREYMADMADQFLHEMGSEYLEEARKQLMTDPCLAEQRLAFDRILDVCEGYIAEEGGNYSSSQVKSLQERLEQIEAHKRQLEAKNQKLVNENNTMKDYLRETREMIQEKVINEQKERVEVARKAEGRGNKVVQPEREVVIGEHQEPVTANKLDEQTNNSSSSLAEQWAALAGLPKKK